MNPHLPSPEAHDEALAERLFAATQPVLRRRRGVRMAGRMAVPVLTFAIGLFVGLGREASTSGDQPDVATPPLVATENTPEPARHDAPRGPELTNPLDMEFLARTTEGPEARALLKRAGDTWLERHRNIEAATRCYLTYLNAGPDEAPEPEDTWLLARLRRAARS